VPNNKRLTQSTALIPITTKEPSTITKINDILCCPIGNVVLKAEPAAEIYATKIVYSSRRKLTHTPNLPIGGKSSFAIPAKLEPSLLARLASQINNAVYVIRHQATNIIQQPNGKPICAIKMGRAKIPAPTSVPITTKILPIWRFMDTLLII